jgi:hypothetical protein
MRVKTDIWIGALTRRLFAEGHYATVERRGAAEAGAIFLRVRHRDGTESLLAPAPQSLFDSEEDTSNRLFERRLSATSGDEIDALITRELSFDPDLWLVEIETDEPEAYVEVVAPD